MVCNENRWVSRYHTCQLHAHAWRSADAPRSAPLFSFISDEYMNKGALRLTEILYKTFGTLYVWKCENIFYNKRWRVSWEAVPRKRPNQNVGQSKRTKKKSRTIKGGSKTATGTPENPPERTQLKSNRVTKEERKRERKRVNQPRKCKTSRDIPPRRQLPPCPLPHRRVPPIQ